MATERGIGFAEDKIRQWGRYAGDPTPEQLTRYFHLSPTDLAHARRRRSPATQLGYGVQLGTVRFLGTFAAVAATPRSVVAEIARQLNIDDSEWSRYVVSRAREVHQVDIRLEHGYHVFGQDTVHVAFLRWLWDRAWTADDSASQLVDLATGWLVEEQILLPGFTVLQRMCATARDRATRLASRRIASQVSPDRRQELRSLLGVQAGENTSRLEQLRRPPRQPSIDGLLAALQRLARIQRLGGTAVQLDAVPVSRTARMVTEAMQVKAQRIHRHSPDRRDATLALFARHVHATAHDDVIDVLLIVLHDLTAKVERLGEQERLRTLGDLDAAALLLARAAQTLLDPAVTDDRVRAATFEYASRAELETAIARVQAIVTHPGDRVAAGMRARYPHIRRFLPALLRHVSFDATTTTDPALAAIKHLAEVEVGKAILSDAPTSHVGARWTALVFGDDGILDAGAYTLCTLDALRLAIRRRDVFVPAALRWGDPRRLLMDKTAWKRNGASVKRALDLDGGPRRLLARLGRELDGAYAHAGEVVTEEPSLLAADRTHERFKVPPLDADPLPASAELLRDQIAALIPTSELPEVLLEVDAWTGFTQAILPATGTARSADLALSICAALLVQACNVPYTAVSRCDVAALTEARLKWVEANYLRAETITVANTRLVDHQARIPLARQWGGGELTSADGLRFVVPVRSIHSGPNPRYFGTGRGITLFNYVADNYLGWASIVVTGTARDSQFLLDRILDNPTSLNPTDIVTDTASASDLNFGLCQLLGYRYMPRLADLPDRRLFRIHPGRDYGPLNPLARHRINIGLIRDHWDDICRVVGTLHTKAAVPSEVIRALQRAGRPVVLARAIAEIGKIVRTIATLDYATRPEQRRRILIQLNRQESRHALARAVCHGRRGQIHQAYRSGQEQQLGALGLVTNAIVLWNTTYMNHAIKHLDGLGTPTTDSDQERLSPLQHEQVNLHGRYSFLLPDHLRAGELRPLLTGTDG